MAFALAQTISRAAADCIARDTLTRKTLQPGRLAAAPGLHVQRCHARPSTTSGAHGGATCRSDTHWSGLAIRFAAKYFPKRGRIRLSPAATRAAAAQRWFRQAGAALDGVMAKRLDLPYRSGDRTAMQKIKPLRTADCVLGGLRYASRGRQVGSLLLGLFNDEGKLDHVGFTSSFTAAERAEITKRIKSHIGPPGFTGKSPGGPSRWSTKRSTEWTRLKDDLVVEVEYDQFTAGRFRHGAKLLRWRPDKAPRQCTFEQVERGGGSLRLLRRS